MIDSDQKRDTLISAGQNRRMFDSIASRYDLMNAILSLGMDGYWRGSAVRCLAPGPGHRVLDIGSGTGDVALEVLRQEPMATVTGIDPASTMLRVARDKALRRGLHMNISFETGDASALRYAAGSFERVISAFCIRNVEVREKAFAEMYRVLKPGGRAVILELTKPEKMTVRQGHRFYNRIIVPTVGRLFSKGDAYRYLVDSIDDFPESEVIVEKMRSGGFEEVRRIPLTFGVVTIFTGRHPI